MLTAFSYEPRNWMIVLTATRSKEFSICLSKDTVVAQDGTAATMTDVRVSRSFVPVYNVK